MSNSPVMESSPREIPDGKVWFNAAISVRPTRHRLLVAMGAASILLAALLALDVDLTSGISDPAVREETLLTVQIRKPEARQKSESTTDRQAIQQSIEDEGSWNESAPAEIVKPQQAARLDEPDDPPIVSGPKRDWNALAKKFAKESTDEHLRREDARASMWQRTRSVMFRPDDDFRVNEEQPLLADMKFRQAVGVLGLGITIGSCFIGIPLAGVPAEERTIGIRLFVCRNDSG